MGINFNSDEIFEIAGQIERNGAAFYRKSAEQASNSSINQLLLQLASDEDKHEKIFASMRSALTDKEKEPTIFDSGNEDVLYLRAFADGHIFNLKANPSDFLDGRKSVYEILKKAIEIEKDSVLFYLGMKDMVPERFGKDKIDNIIKEEMKHIALLSQRMMLS